MNTTTKNAALGFFALFAIATLGSYFGSTQADPADAEPNAVILQPSDLDSVRLLPKEQRVQYITPSNFNDTIQQQTPSANQQQPSRSRVEPAAFVNGVRIVVVHEGDTLSSIAHRELGDSKRYHDIMRWNNIVDERSITIGLKLQIRLNESAVVAEPADAAIPRANIEQLYEVQSGDILGRISLKFYGTSKKVDLIIKANNLKSADSIRVGQKLIIPAE